MDLKDYETIFILSPVLSENQLKDAIGKYKKIIKDNGADIIHEENWGMKKLAYAIQHKSTGFYQLFQYKAPTKIVSTLVIEFRRDDKILRFQTVSLDKYALEFNEKRKKGLLISQKEAAKNKEPDKTPKETGQAKPEDKKPPVPAKEVKETVEKPETV